MVACMLGSANLFEGVEQINVALIDAEGDIIAVATVVVAGDSHSKVLSFIATHPDNPSFYYLGGSSYGRANDNDNEVIHVPPSFTDVAQIGGFLYCDD